MFLLILQVRCVLYSRNNGPFGQSNTFSRYPYQMAYAYDRVQTSSLIGKVMGLLAFSFLFAFIGTFVGFFYYSYRYYVLDRCSGRSGGALCAATAHSTAWH